MTAFSTNAKDDPPRKIESTPDIQEGFRNIQSGFHMFLTSPSLTKEIYSILLNFRESSTDSLPDAIQANLVGGLAYGYDHDAAPEPARK